MGGRTIWDGLWLLCGLCGLMDIPGLVICYSLLLKMAIEIVDLPIKDGDLSIGNCEFTRVMMFSGLASCLH